MIYTWLYNFWYISKIYLWVKFHFFLTFSLISYFCIFSIFVFEYFMNSFKSICVMLCGWQIKLLLRSNLWVVFALKKNCARKNSPFPSWRQLMIETNICIWGLEIGQLKKISLQAEVEKHKNKKNLGPWWYNWAVELPILDLFHPQTFCYTR